MFTKYLLIFLLTQILDQIHTQLILQNNSSAAQFNSTSQVYQAQENAINLPPLLSQTTFYVNYTAPAQPQFTQNYPNFQTVVSYMGGIGYGISDLGLRTAAAGKTIFNFSRLAGFVTMAGKLSNFVGPIVSMVMSLIFPSPSTQDVIDQLSAKIDASTAAILSQMQESFNILASYIHEQSLDIKKSIYEINQYAAYRALLEDVAILENLNAVVARNEDYGKSWIYELFPCGSAMSLCNNAYASIAYSLDDLLSAVQLYSFSEYGADCPQVQAYGTYFLTLLSQATISLAKVNKLYAETQVQSYDIFDFEIHVAMTNSERLQANFLKALATYEQYMGICNQYQTVVNYEEVPLDNKVIKGINFQNTSGYDASYSSNIWQNQLILPATYASTAETPFPLGSYLNTLNQHKITNCSDISQCETYFHHPFLNSSLTIQGQCPPGSFLFSIDFFAIDYQNILNCAQLSDTISFIYEDTYSVTFTDQVDFVSGGNCSQGGYYMTGFIREVINIWTIQDIYTLKNSIYHISFVPYIHQSVFETTVYCAKPSYQFDYQQCQMIRKIFTSKTFLILNNEMVNIDSLLVTGLFLSNNQIIYVNELPYVEGPTFDARTVLIEYNNTFHLTNPAGRYLINDQDTFTACQFNPSAATVIDNATSLLDLPLISVIDMANSDLSQRINEVQLLQSNMQASQWANYTFNFTNLNPLPKNTTFLIFLSPQFVVSNQWQTCYLRWSNSNSQFSCSFNVSSFVLTATGLLNNYIPANTNIQLTVGLIKNPYSNQNLIDPLALYIYSDRTLQGLVEGSHRNIVPKLNCNWPCYTCAENNTNSCLSCYNNDSSSVYLYKNTCLSSCSFLTYSNLNGTMCYDSCPQKTYQAQQTCVDCRCKDCNDQYNQSCTSCDSNGLYPFFYQNQCMKVCPSNSFLKNATCIACNNSCTTCQNASVCLSCNSGFSLFNNTCISACPPGWYAYNNICTQCNPACKSCYGPTPYNCISCYQNSSALPNLFGSTCVNKCPNTTIMSNFTCGSCTWPCLACNQTYNSCTSCVSGTYLYNNVCYQTCPPGSSLYNNKCNNCGICQTCSQVSACTSCGQTSAYPYYYGGTCNKLAIQLSHLIAIGDDSTVDSELEISSNHTMICSSGKNNITWIVTDTRLQQNLPTDGSQGFLSAGNELFIGDNVFNETTYLKISCSDGQYSTSKEYTVRKIKNSPVFKICVTLGALFFFFVLVLLFYIWRRKYMKKKTPLVNRTLTHDNLNSSEIKDSQHEHSTSQILPQINTTIVVNNNTSAQQRSVQKKRGSLVEKITSKLSFGQNTEQFARCFDEEVYAKVQISSENQKI